MNKDAFSRLFPFGSHLCRKPMPDMAELKRDMENLKRHGFNLVKLQEQWFCDEPAEGQYDFSVYEELIEYAGQLDLGVYLGFTMEQAPHWLWVKHPGCRMVGRNGLPIAYEAQSPLPADGKPGPCYDHEGAMEESLRFLRQAVAVLGRYENVVVWNTWQEISYRSDCVGQDICYCEHTLAAFRDWLRQEYGDIDTLNRTWKTRYLDWGPIVPSRMHGRDVLLPHDVEWRHFLECVRLPRILARRAKAIRQADPLDRPVFAHVGHPTIAGGAEWRFARAQDFLGSSCYPAGVASDGWDDLKPPYKRDEALTRETWFCVALRLDYIRCANREDAPVWAAEFQGGPLSTVKPFHWGRVPAADDIRRWLFTAIGSGVTAIAFWVTRAEIAAFELNGYSLLDSEGDTTERFAAAARIGQALNRHPEIFAARSTARAKVAILVNDWNYRFCAAAQLSGHLAFSTQGWYKLLWDLNVPVDFLDTSELDAPCATEYRMIIMPFPLSLRDDDARKLVRYVESGGHLVSEACPGRVDGYGHAPRGELSPALRPLFGVSHERLTMVREPDGAARWSPRERTWGEFVDAVVLEGAGPLAGQSLRAHYCIETFGCDASEVCLRYGDTVAGTVRHVGTGSAWLFGTFVGFGGTAYVDGKTHSLVRELLSACGVVPEHVGKLRIRKRKTQAAEAWIITNPHGEPVTEVIEARGFGTPSDILDGDVALRDGELRLTVPALDVRVILLPRA